jgi:hypothetical protein
MGRKIKKRGGKIGEGILEKSGNLPGKFGKGFTGFFPGFASVGAFSGTAVMARRTGHRDRGVGKARRGAAGVRCRRKSRHARRGERERTVARV